MAALQGRSARAHRQGWVTQQCSAAYGSSSHAGVALQGSAAGPHALHSNKGEVGGCMVVHGWLVLV